MKIGIITLLGSNYGNRLQNYAVQELLGPYGEVSTVRYERKTVNAPKKSRFQRCMPSHILDAVNSRLLNIYHISDRRKNLLARTHCFVKNRDRLKAVLAERERAFQRFDEQYIRYEQELLHLTGDDNSRWVKAYDAWVCGSDQIWNPTYPTATRNAFLQFAQPQRRIALSASMGVSDIENMLPEYAAWIADIPHLSVREYRAAEIVQELTGRNAEVFLDPTMLIPCSKWDAMADAADVKLPPRYAVSYFLGIREKAYQNYIDAQLHQKQLAHVDLLNGEAVSYLSYAPDQFVAAIRGADVVFTDSFHGAVFAILYQKPFVVFERSESDTSMNSRLQTLLKRFDMEDRMFSSCHVPNVDAPIDYASTKVLLEHERQRVQLFLDKAMADISVLPKQQNTALRHIHLNHPAQCSGCTACSQVCPKGCISMEADAEGFVYPRIDEHACVNCGRCEQICPVRHHENGNHPAIVLAEKNHDEGIRQNSSSGGVFFELAAACIRNGGVVYGCALDDEMVARHVRVDNLNELHRLQSSKYVQSDMGSIMAEIRLMLENNRNVLFSGTPCQVAGLRNFLGRPYDNLLMIDVLCHGVPSPKLFADYLDYLSEQHGGGKPITVNFRSKRRGWKRLYMEVCFDNGRRHYIFSGYDRYESLFLTNKSLRPSCYECKFASSQRFGDITLGDFWGIGKKHPQWDDDKGISAVMLNTPRGKAAWQRISSQFEGMEESFDTLKNGQRTLYAPTQKHPQRDLFYQLYIEKGAKAALETYTKVPCCAVRAYYAVMRWGLDRVRRLLQKGY